MAQWFPPLREYHPRFMLVRLLIQTRRKYTAPIDKLHDDCLLEIFRILRPVTPPNPLYSGEVYSQALMIESLRAVCKRWNFVIDSRPSFWNVIFLGINHGYSIERSLRFMRRSGTAPLHIYLRGGLTDAPIGPGLQQFANLMRNLQQAFPRISSLQLSEPDLEICRLFWGAANPVATSTGSPFHIAMESLTHLSLHIPGQNYTHQQLIELLRQAPRLRSLYLAEILKEDNRTYSTVSLPHLQLLRLVKSRIRILGSLEVPPRATVEVHFPHQFPRRDQSARDEIIEEFLPPSFSQSKAVFLAVVEGESPLPMLSMRHEDTPAGRHCYIRLVLRDHPYADINSPFRLATDAVKDSKHVETIHLDIRFILLPGSLVRWLAGFPNLRTLTLSGAHISHILIDLLFAEGNCLPQLEVISLKGACSIQVASLLERCLAARARGKHPVKLEHII